MTGRHRQEIASYGALLRQYRMSTDLSQEALAERAGLSTRAVSDPERGVSTRPHPATLHALELDSDARAVLAAVARPAPGGARQYPPRAGRSLG